MDRWIGEKKEKRRKKKEKEKEHRKKTEKSRRCGGVRIVGAGVGRGIVGAGKGGTT